MYHHSDRKNRLFFIGYIPIQSIRFCISKLPCGGGPCSRIISCLQHWGHFSFWSSHHLPLLAPQQVPEYWNSSMDNARLVLIILLTYGITIHSPTSTWLARVPLSPLPCPP